MKKSVLKLYEDEARSVFDYERVALEEPQPEPEPEPDEEEEQPDPAAIRNAVLAEAREEAERKVKEAFEEGHRRGTEAGLAEFREAVKESAAALGQAASAIEAANTAFLESLEPQVIALVREIAGRVVRREVRTDAALIETTAREALARLARAERVVVRVNPGDLEALRTQQVALLEEFKGILDIEVQADGDVGSGGCLAESKEVLVDALVDTQLGELLRALEDVPEVDVVGGMDEVDGETGAVDS